jgi:hypothetical protein
MTPRFDLSKSLQELEEGDWGEPTHESGLVATCHRLRRKPLSEFTIEDLRVMIGQGIGLSYLIPLALERMEEEPLAEGDYFPGDLLAAVSRVDEAFWKAEADSAQRIRQVVLRAKDVVLKSDQAEYQPIREVLKAPPRLWTE